MKNFVKFLDITVLVVVIVFSITACGGGGGGGGNVRVKGINNNGNPNARSVLGARAISNGDITNDATFTPFTTFYNNFASNGLGAKKSSITPTSFKVPVASIMFYDAVGNTSPFDPAHNVNADGGMLDFATGVTLTLNDVPNNVTCAGIEFHLMLSVGSTPWGSPTVTFPWTSGESNFNSTYSPTWSGNNATVLTNKFHPKIVQDTFHITGTTLPEFMGFYYDSTKTQRSVAIRGQDTSMPSIVIPFNQFTIDGPVTITISWNLSGMIEVYEGATNNATDDIYVLKKDFWDSLYMSITQ